MFEHDFSTTKYGIDVSHHQGEIDWDKTLSYKFQDRDLSLVFMKATEGGDYVDPMFSKNWSIVKNYEHLTKGAYHFYRTQKEPKLQSENLIKTLRSVEFDTKDYYIIDVEQNGGKLSQEEFSHQLSEFTDEMKDNGYNKSIIYTTKGFWDQNIGSHGKDLWKTCDLWLARYGKNDGDIPENPKFYQEVPIGASSPPMVWQFTSKGKIEGINGNVDLSLLSKNFNDKEQVNNTPSLGETLYSYCDIL